MDTQTDPRLQMGANNPPDPLLVECEERIDTANKWLTERKEITDAETADKLTFFISQAEASWKALDGQRLQEGRDFDAKQKTKYTSPLTLLKMAKEKLVEIRGVWLKKEQDRIDAERAEAQKKIDDARREAEEAVARAEKEAAKKKGGDVLRSELAVEEAKAKVAEVEKAVEAMPDRAQIKGTYTTKAVGLREYWSAEITDAALAFKTYKKRPEVVAAIRDAMERVAKADSQKLKDLTAAPEGVKFTMEKR